MVSAEETANRQKRIDEIISAVDDHAGPRSLVVLTVVDEDLLGELKARAIQNAEFSTAETLKIAIRDLSSKFSGKRLAVIVATSSSFLELQVPAGFVSLEIISGLRKNVHLAAESSYCSIPLALWNNRASYYSHELNTRAYICLEVPDYDFPSEDIPPPFQFATEDDAPDAAEKIKVEMESGATTQVSSRQSRVLPWVAAAAGAGASLTTAAVLVTKFNFSVWGAYVTCGPLTAAVGTAFGSGSLAMTAAATAGVGIASVAAGVGVAAVVYFIPWHKLVNWASKAWDLFMIFVKSVWQFFKTAWKWFVSFLKMLLKALQKFLTHVKNAALFTGKLLFGGVFGSSDSS